MLSKPKRGTSSMIGGDGPMNENVGTRLSTEVTISGKTKNVKKLRYAEYYNNQEQYDNLYQKSLDGESFTKLMKIITSEKNIALAYRNIKKNSGSKTPGSDGKTIKDIEKFETEQVIKRVRNMLNNYHPRTVRRKDIPKPNGTTRPLGIPCIWDRLVQQCILQVLEPICEAKFFQGSYGFRPLKSAENAMNDVYRYINRSHLYYMVEIDIKSFFDNVNHTKLIKQMWSLGIQDKQLICIIKKILKANIQMPNGEIITPSKGTPQGGIISPLLANIVLNEFDWHMESQWSENPLVYKWKGGHAPNGTLSKGSAFREMRKTNLKELHTIRYADDIRILCSNKLDAEKVKDHAIKWLGQRLKLEISKEKTRVVNLNKQYGEFLGIKIRTKRKGNKRVVVSHMCDKAIRKVKTSLKEQIIVLEHSGSKAKFEIELAKYNSIVRGVHNYYSMATNITEDCQEIHNSIYKSLYNRLHPEIGRSIPKTYADYKNYKNCRRFAIVQGRYMLPIVYCSHRQTLGSKKNACIYTKEGRKTKHDDLTFNNKYLLSELSENPITNRSIEYNDNRLSLFSAQRGKCAITGYEFLAIEEVHCHHKTPRKNGGKDNYQNLILVLPDVHKLIHAKREQTILKYLKILDLNNEQLEKVNKLRIKAELPMIVS